MGADGFAPGISQWQGKDFLGQLAVEAGELPEQRLGGGITRSELEEWIKNGVAGGIRDGFPDDAERGAAFVKERQAEERGAVERVAADAVRRLRRRWSHDGVGGRRPIDHPLAGNVLRWG